MPLPACPTIPLNTMWSGEGYGSARLVSALASSGASAARQSDIEMEQHTLHDNYGADH